MYNNNLWVLTYNVCLKKGKKKTQSHLKIVQLKKIIYHFWQYVDRKIAGIHQALEVVISAWGWNYGFFLFSFISEFSKVSKVSMHTVFNEKNII